MGNLCHTDKFQVNECCVGLVKEEIGFVWPLVHVKPLPSFLLWVDSELCKVQFSSPFDLCFSWFSSVCL